MTQHLVTIHATSATHAGIEADAIRQLAAYLAPLEDADHIAALLVSRTTIAAEPTARTLDGQVIHCTAEITIRFSAHDLAPHR